VLEDLHTVCIMLLLHSLQWNKLSVGRTVNRTDGIYQSCLSLALSLRPNFVALALEICPSLQNYDQMSCGTTKLNSPLTAVESSFVNYVSRSTFLINLQWILVAVHDRMVPASSSFSTRSCCFFTASFIASLCIMEWLGFCLWTVPLVWPC